jgi:lipopolysaccharide transport system permease protein
VKNLLWNIWAYRGFIAGSVKREFQLKYQRSLLGAAWVVINPLAMILVYTVIFSRVMQARLPGADNPFAYSIYLCAGICVWGFFAEIVNRAQVVYIENANLLKKVSFPPICLPLITVLNAALNAGIIFIIFAGFLVITGNFPGWCVLALVPVLVVAAAFSAGLGVMLGVLNVFFRDIGAISGVLLQFWFWGTPVVYPLAILPEWMQRHMSFNPMAGLVSACQSIFVAGQWPDWGALMYAAWCAGVVCCVGGYLFWKHSGEMVDEL